MKRKILSLSKSFSGYGHYKIIVHTNKGDLTCITSNMRAIDGHDGGNRALVSECIRKNNMSENSFTGFNSLKE